MSKQRRPSKYETQQEICKDSVLNADWDSLNNEGYSLEIPQWTNEKLNDVRQFLCEILEQKRRDGKNLPSISGWIREQMKQIPETQVYWKEPLLKEALQIEERMDELWENCNKQYIERSRQWNKQFSGRLSQIEKEFDLRRSRGLAVWWRDKGSTIEDIVGVLNELAPLSMFRQGKEWSCEEVNELLAEYD